MRRASATETARISFSETVAAPLPKKGEKPHPATQSTRTVTPQQLEDIYFQASTRGGREFDSILAGKAQFKSVSNTVGNAALVGAAAATMVAANSNDRKHQRDAAAAAGALLLVGLVAKGVSEATEADADIRYWDNLPDRVHAVTLPLPAALDKLSVDFLAGDGSVLRTREATITRAGTCGLAWVRGESAIPGNPRAPYSAPKETMYAPVVIPTRQAPEGPSALPGDKPADYAPKPAEPNNP